MNIVIKSIVKNIKVRNSGEVKYEKYYIKLQTDTYLSSTVIYVTLGSESETTNLNAVAVRSNVNTIPKRSPRSSVPSENAAKAHELINQSRRITFLSQPSDFRRSFTLML